MNYLPEFVLFGASMTEWSFDEKTQGFGWFLRNKYEGKVQVLNEGTVDRCPILDHVLADRNLDYTIVRNEC
jgi:hypothetical protein